MIQTISVIQEELLLLLEKFHGICMEHRISYSLHGGTLLGAVREQGFIPWDDDADVSLTRAEFRKLQAVLRQEKLGPEFRYDEDGRYTRLVMKRPGKPPVWADIFVYDYISPHPLARRLKLLGNYFFVLFTRTREEQRRSNQNGLYSGAKKLAINAVAAAGNLFPRQLRLKLAEANMQSFPGNRSLIHRANDQYIGISMTLPAGVMDNYKLVPFERTELMISARYDEILTSSYGADYMIPRQDKPAQMHAVCLAAEQKRLETQFAEEIDGKGEEAP